VLRTQRHTEVIHNKAQINVERWVDPRIYVCCPMWADPNFPVHIFVVQYNYEDSVLTISQMFSRLRGIIAALAYEVKHNLN
jgi:hypothetical protein